jgi:hypothetical protein
LRVIADAVVACIARTHARRTARAGASLTGVSIGAIKPIITGCAIRDGLEQAAILGVVTDAAVACVSWATTRRSCRASASLTGVSIGAEQTVIAWGRVGDRSRSAAVEVLIAGARVALVARARAIRRATSHAGPRRAGIARSAEQTIIARCTIGEGITRACLGGLIADTCAA